MENISIQLEKVFGFIPKEEIYGYAAKCETAQEMLHQGTGKGNDFLG